MQRTTELQMRRSADGLLAESLMLSLWVGDVLLAAEYWLLQGARLGVATIATLFGRPLGLALMGATVFAGVLTLSARSNATWERARSASRDEAFILNAAVSYRGDAGRWPDRLEVLVPKYLREVRSDPWGRKYLVHQGPGGFAVVSSGPDREFGTADDLVAFASKKQLQGE